MVSTIIPDDVAQFIMEKIDSVAQMEALLLVSANPDQRWGAEDLAKRLYMSEEQTAGVLASLCAFGLLTTDGSDPPSFQYRPSSNELRSMVDRLIEIYTKHLLPVSNLIHSKPKTRVQEFAEAFRLRKDK